PPVPPQRSEPVAPVKAKLPSSGSWPEANTWSSAPDKSVVPPTLLSAGSARPVSVFLGADREFDPGSSTPVVVRFWPAPALACRGAMIRGDADSGVSEGGGAGLGVGLNSPEPFTVSS